MQFKNIAVFAAMLFMGQAIANPVAAPVNTLEVRDADGITVATDPHSACNCPNNCEYRAGHSCRFHTGPSDSSKIYKGHCVDRNGRLGCE